MGLRLRLRLPSAFVRQGEDLYVVPAPSGELGLDGEPGAPSCGLEFLPTLPAVADPAAWLDEQLFAKTPPGSLVTGLRKEALRTEAEWPMFLALGVVGRPLGAAGGERSEQEVRMAALYRFLDRNAGLLLRCTTPWFERHRAELLAILATGTPNWRGPELVALADLWEPE